LIEFEGKRILFDTGDDSQAGGVEGGEHRPVFEIVGVVEYAGDFFPLRQAR
jgi:hypothetical protein